MDHHPIDEKRAFYIFVSLRMFPHGRCPYYVSLSQSRYRARPASRRTETSLKCSNENSVELISTTPSIPRDMAAQAFTSTFLSFSNCCSDEMTSSFLIPR